MNTVNEILTKKDYSNKEKYHLATEQSFSGTPLWIKIVFVLCMILASIGEQKTLNVMFKALPKAITIGVIALAFFYGIYKSDYRSLKKILVPIFMYVAMLVLIMIYSLVIWVFGFTETTSILRGCSKLMIQLIALLTAASGVYLFKKESIKLFFISFCICNTLIMLIEMPKFGVAESISSLVHVIVTFGEAKGFARELEVHDLTYIMGQFFVYYVLFAPNDTKALKKEKWIGAILSGFFFMAGLKRIAFLGLCLAVVIGLVLRNRKHRRKIVIYSGVVMVGVLFVYVYMIRSGDFVALLEKFNIDTMGRANAWAMAAEYYEFSPVFLGRGFESVDAIVKEWAALGLTQKAQALHNDYLRIFIELGIYGFAIWVTAQCVIYPILLGKYYDDNTVCVYACIFIYMSTTFMTCNTAFSFWSTMILRLIPMAYASTVEKAEPVLKWKPPTSKEMEGRIRELSERI